MIAQPGLKWESALWGAEPQWTLEPDIEVIEKIVHQHLGTCKDRDALSIEFFGQGAFNKLYTVRCAKRSYMMRVSLPVDPGHKTLSEVATLAFVRANTDIPVPQVMAYDASHQNELGFEWIIMELMPGKTYDPKWKTLSMASKEEMVRRLAYYSAQLFRLKFSGIGNIYRKADSTSPEEESTIGKSLGTTHEITTKDNTAEGNTPKETILKQLANHLTQLFRTMLPGVSSTGGQENRSSSIEEHMVGRIVSIPFFYKDRLHYDVPRGPFAASRDWLTARLSLARLECDAVLSNPPEDDPDYAVEEATLVKSVVDRLSMRHQWLFPQTQSTEKAKVPLETTALLHDDINEDNILVDDDGNMTALVDWENVSVVPLWRACQFPKFLQGHERDEKPDPEEFAEPIEENQLYWEKLREFEQTQLRRVFLEEMERLEPVWVAIHRQSVIRQDFDEAIQMSDNGWSCKWVDQWLDIVDAGKEGVRLRGRRDEYDVETLDLYI